MRSPHSQLHQSLVRVVAALSIAALPALAGCPGQAGTTCEYNSDCASGLRCSNCGDRTTWPRGVCTASIECPSASDSGPTGDANADAGQQEDALMSLDSGADAFTAPRDAASTDTASTDTASTDAGRDSGPDAGPDLKG